MKNVLLEWIKLSLQGFQLIRTVSSYVLIKNLPTPENITQVRSVLGTTGFYLRCKPNFSGVVEPMRRLIKKRETFQWRLEQEHAFNRVKDLIVKAYPLAIFIRSQILMSQRTHQIKGWGPYFCRNTQRRYSTGEKEALSCLFATERWHIFLWGRRFWLRTDHQ